MSAARALPAALLLCLSIAGCGPSNSKATCPPGTRSCGNGCADLASDPLNCGSCGAACAGGNSCSLGHCVARCPTGTIDCGGACVDPMSSVLHCGDCATACGGTQRCASGRCVDLCARGLTDCNGSCIDARSDPMNCGRCGAACPNGQSCSNGSCVCGQGLIACGASCVNPMSDPANCGGCGIACPSSNCANGICDCRSGLAHCGGSCVDLQSDNNNCGSCGVRCGAGQCSAGVCSCPVGLTSCNGACVDTGSDPMNCGACGNLCPNGAGCGSGQCMGAITTMSNIHHTILIVQENHTFDAYFGHYCTAPAFSNPDCTQGPGCCEGAPDVDPEGNQYTVLDDAQNAGYDPNHNRSCEVTEMDNGAMDHYTDASCGNVANFAVADAAAKPYWDLATQGALADRYFQPLIGASYSNDMYFARAQYVFTDNDVVPDANGEACSPIFGSPRMTYTDPTIADLLVAHGNSFVAYAEGYAAMRAATFCPSVPNDCTAPFYEPPVCWYAPGDVPWNYYSNFVDNPAYLKDLAVLATDLAQGTLPDVAFVKAVDYHSEHPGHGTTISNGQAFVSSVLQSIAQSSYASDTLVLLTWDEGGGFYDHVGPPPPSTIDGQPYGTRVPLIVLGPFAQSGTVSHVTLEHSSIVAFIEWNYLGGQTGQLNGRDAVVSNLGSLVDPAAAGVSVPQ